MKKILSLMIVAGAVLAGCSDSFLDSDNLTKKDNTVFPKNTTDAEQLLTSVYTPLLGDIEYPFCTAFMQAELMSDERLGAGGTDDREAQAVAAFMKVQENQYAKFWELKYQGIYRANFLIASEPNIEWDSEASQNRIMGEAYFMRALHYLELGRAFGNVPLVLTPDPANNPQATPEELYGRIAADFLKAAELMPDTRWAPGTGTDGHATRWAAQGMLARAFLFYIGYYNQESIALPDGGTLTRQQVASLLDDCIANSGHNLVPDFRNLWPYSAAKDYKFNDTFGLQWVTEDGSNPEAMFVIKHSGAGADVDGNNHSRNNETLFFSLRYQDEGGNAWVDCYPFGSGWGIGTVTPDIYETWPVDDPRRAGSILNVDDPAEGLLAYHDGCQAQVHDTHLFNKKYTAISTKTDDPAEETYLGPGITSLYWKMYPNFMSLDYQNNSFQDFFVLRFADVRLMGAELGSANGQTYFNRVRARAGLQPLPLTLENIKNERRWELAFEGIRYYDLLRWHDENLITAHRTNVKVKNLGVDATVSVPFRAETKGLLPIPDQEIQKAQGMLVQNPGWASNEGNY